ncbi:MAG TPA: HypC/HybG/HupF family hydrogenase formation chaperone [Candidatus Limnocylindrales bacterium]|nr:HypC/HybG/HupF family hydrogenase formation chaperone [Candidatus Limnocylindrales bacterium]
MCLGIPGRIIERSPDHANLASVEVEGIVREINIALLEGDPQPGDWVLIHLGFALETMTEEEARDAMATAAILAEGGTDDPLVPFRFADEDDTLAAPGFGRASPPTVADAAVREEARS